MAIKVDRPVDFGGDGIVVYVAKSLDEVNKTRAAFAEAGVPVELPEAAIEAMWAAGRTSLPIRVKPDHYKAALDVIDELFPPPELVLPGAEEEEEAEEAESSSGPALEGAGEAGDEGRGGPMLATVDVERGKRQAAKKKAGPDASKLKGSLLKLIFMAAVSLAIPGGAVLAAFALWGSVWCWRTLDRVVGGEAAMGRAKLAMGLSGFALVWGVGFAAFVAWQQGWLG